MHSVSEVHSGRREWLALAVLALPAMLVGMDLTVLNLAVPALSEDLEPSSAELLWIVDIYGFLSAGSFITMGTLGDRIGRRRLLLIGAGAFGVASVLAALSQSAVMLIAARALLGVAGATLMPSALSLASQMFADPRRRPLAIGVVIASFSGGTAIGPLVGGALLEQFWWGSVFLIGVPVMALLLTVGPKLLPEYRNPDAGRLDLPSAVLSLAAILLVIYGLKQIAEDGFGSPAALSIPAGLALAVVFLRRQGTLVDPLVDLQLFRAVGFTVSLATLLLGIFVLHASYLYLGQYLQLVLGQSPLEAGLWTVPAAGAVIVGSTLASRLARWTRRAYVIGSGLALTAAGFLALTALDPGSGLALLVSASVVISLGLGPVMTLTTDLVVASAPRERAGAAASLSETSGVLGGALGIAVIGSAATAVYRDQVADRLPPDIPSGAAEAARDTLGGAVGAAGQLPDRLGAELIAGASEAFTDAVHIAAAASATLMAATALLAAVLLRRVREGADAGATPAASRGEVDLVERLRGRSARSGQAASE
jgi:MFS transporter, DHA2 family, multidrug resistance protein